MRRVLSGLLMELAVILLGAGIAFAGVADDQYQIAEACVCQACGDVSGLPEVPGNTAYEALRASAIDSVDRAAECLNGATVYLQDAIYWRGVALQWRMRGDAFQESAALTKCRLAEAECVDLCRSATQAALIASAFARQARELRQ